MMGTDPVRAILPDPIRPAPRVLFFGMQGNFSSPVLDAVLKSGIQVSAVVVPAVHLPGVKLPPIKLREPSQLMRKIVPMVHRNKYGDLYQLCASRSIPVWEVSRLSHNETFSTLASYQPDCICVACFSRRIPIRLLTLPTLGCLNAHPSLLPANRGPVPLFWSLWEGQQRVGVTIHEMAEHVDSGAILAQDLLDVPDGISYDALESDCAALAGTLMARTVWDLYDGCATPVPQNEAQSSYYSFPTADDFIIDASTWEARRLYNFVRGVRNWDFSIVVRFNGEDLYIRDAAAFYTEENIPVLETGLSDRWGMGMTRMIRCRSGWVQVLLKKTE